MAAPRTENLAEVVQRPTMSNGDAGLPHECPESVR